MKKTKREGKPIVSLITMHIVWFFVALGLISPASSQDKTNATKLTKPIVVKGSSLAQPLSQKALHDITQFREARTQAKQVTGEIAKANLQQFYGGPLKQFDVKPDLVIQGVRTCRAPRGDGYVDWTITVDVKNQGGSYGINSQIMPVALYVDFDPNMPWGQGSVGAADVEPTINFNKDEAWMQVPTEPGSIRTWIFNETYPDCGPCQRPCYRMVPTNFWVFVDQMANGYPGPIEESNEYNNGNGVMITGYDEVNGYTGVPQWCWNSWTSQ